jgi:hypothetical protein
MTTFGQKHHTTPPTQQDSTQIRLISHEVPLIGYEWY